MDQSKKSGQEGFVESPGGTASLASGQIYPDASSYRFDPTMLQASVNPNLTQSPGLQGAPTLGDAGGDLGILDAYQRARGAEQYRVESQANPAGPVPVTPASLPLLIQIMQSLFGGGQAAPAGGAAPTATPTPAVPLEEQQAFEPGALQASLQSLFGEGQSVN